MVCGDLSSVGGQSTSTDESDSTVSLNVNVRLITVYKFILES